MFSTEFVETFLEANSMLKLSSLYLNNIMIDKIIKVIGLLNG